MKRFGLASVHPHGSGDSLRYSERSTSDHGSPPREWGQLPAASDVEVIERFTPTGVGTAHLIGEVLTSCRRFTPTGVGTAATISVASVSVAVHPHGSGDSLIWLHFDPAASGSPPREWGQHGQNLRGDGQERFTPTGVGTASDLRGQSPRGERFTPTGVGTAESRLSVHFLLNRFTPTGVGTAPGTATGSPVPPVHPHGSGDSESFTPVRQSRHGSPPREWGQPNFVILAGIGSRFTPTGVGTA